MKLRKVHNINNNFMKKPFDKIYILIFKGKCPICFDDIQFFLFLCNIRKKQTKFIEIVRKSA